MHQTNVLSKEDFDKLPDPSTKLQAWAELSALLGYIKDVEQHARIAAFDLYYPKLRESGETGVRNYDLGAGYVLKGTPSVNYKVDPEKIDAVLAKMERLGSEGKLLAERLVKFNPELSVSEYKALDPSASRQQAKVKELIDDAITAKPGMPKLELVTPKSAVA